VMERADNLTNSSKPNLGNQRHRALNWPMMKVCCKRIKQQMKNGQKVIGARGEKSWKTT
jgi:hypothetical protein